jgi:hypothetical protein
MQLARGDQMGELLLVEYKEKAGDLLAAAITGILHLLFFSPSLITCMCGSTCSCNKMHLDEFKNPCKGY